MTALNEQALEAAAKAMCRNPYECVMGSGSITVGGESSFECHRYAWQDQLGRAEAAIRAYIAALDPAPGWQDMSSAPKDGTWLFLYVPGHGPARARWTKLNNWLSTNGKVITKATHWMPLPSPPRQAGGHHGA